MVEQVFDFNYLPDLSAFYQDFAERFSLTEDFGANLDALWDVITGDIELPLAITFINLSPIQKTAFSVLITLFEEAVAELEGDFVFTVSD